jgi:hypothetical protein
MDQPMGLLTSRLAKGEAVSWSLCPQKNNKILDEIEKDRYYRRFENRVMEGVAEWSKAPDVKLGVGAILPWVRIPPLPPTCWTGLRSRSLGGTEWR